MKNYINNNKAAVISRAVIVGVFVLTAVIALVFDDVTPATMLFI